MSEVPLDKFPTSTPYIKHLPMHREEFLTFDYSGVEFEETATSFTKKHKISVGINTIPPGIHLVSDLESTEFEHIQELRLEAIKENKDKDFKEPSLPYVPYKYTFFIRFPDYKDDITFILLYEDVKPDNLLSLLPDECKDFPDNFKLFLVRMIKDSITRIKDKRDWFELRSQKINEVERLNIK